MKMILSITMSVLFLFQGTAANMEVCEQLEELSHFLSHYQDHKEDDGYSFVEYVYKDYIADDGTSEDHHQDSEHNDAPVHTSHQCCQHFVFFAPFQAFKVEAVLAEKQQRSDNYTFQLNSRYLESLFQPPKV